MNYLPAILIIGFLLISGCISIPSDTPSPTTPISTTVTTRVPTTPVIPTTIPVTGPTIRDIIPGEGTAGSTVSITDLDGSNFQNGATVTLVKSGYRDITATNVNVLSSSRITCTFSLPSNVGSGSWDVVVTNPDGQYGISTNLFIIRASVTPAETTMPAGGIGITSITPRFAASSNSTVDILVFGSNFQNSISAKLNQSGKADIPAYRTYVLDIAHTQV
ncbi:MAG TPA: hypothetical protein VFG36_06860, partial [Methanoregula sp.]|nr:hypothetical protein [Methanoregula sp.]